MCVCVHLCVCVRHAPRLLATLGLSPPAFYPLELDSSAAALYAHGVFIKVVFILRDIFGASFALFLCVSVFFNFPFFLHFLLVFALLFAAPNNTILLTIFSHLFFFRKTFHTCGRVGGWGRAFACSLTKS